MRLTILREAELEAAEAAAWYDDRPSGLGDDFLAEVAEAFARISSDPREFSRLESCTGSHEVRRCVLDRFPYVVVFLCRSEEILVVATAHSRRRPLYWLARLG